MKVKRGEKSVADLRDSMSKGMEAQHGMVGEEDCEQFDISREVRLLWAVKGEKWS